MEILSLFLATSLAFSNSQIQTCYSIDEIETESETTEINGLTHIGGFSNPDKILDSFSGYVYYDVQVYKTPFTYKSNLFIVNVTAEYTPGYQALLNGHNNYLPYQLYNGYLHCRSERSGIVNTYDPKFITALPDTSSFTTTFTSSSSTAYSFNSELKCGIDLVNGISLSGSAGKGLTVSYNHEISTTYSDPYISKQYSPSNSREIEWNYTCSSTGVARLATYKLNAYYIFEMDKTTIDIKSNAFIFYIDIGMTNKKDYEIHNQSETIKIECFCEYC